MLKAGLEERQSEVAAGREKRKEVWRPQFFLHKKNKATGEREWTFTHSYWAQRRQNVAMWRQMGGGGGRVKGVVGSSPALLGEAGVTPISGSGLGLGLSVSTSNSNLNVPTPHTGEEFFANDALRHFPSPSPVPSSPPSPPPTSSDEE